MGNGDIGSDKPNLGGPNSVPGGGNAEIEARPKLTEEELKEKNEREEAERKKRIQLYVFILRSVAYPFNAKQPSDMNKRHLKVTKDGHEKMKARIESFLRGETQIPKDEAFKDCIEIYLAVFLRSERIAQSVSGGALSQHDCREVFRHQSEKKIRTLPEIDGLSKDTVVTSWMAKYDALMKDDDNRRPGQRPTTAMLGNEIMNKEQLYDLFQQILNVKKFEHQLLYNAMQIDNADEQTSTIRRELDARQGKISEMERNRKLMPKFVLKEMESLYIEEMNAAINLLKSNLESLPVSIGNQLGSKPEGKKMVLPFNKLGQKKGGRSQSTVKGDAGDDEIHGTLSKSDVVLTFQLE